MRVSQIQNLAWAGNVLVFAGLVWIGWQFLDARRQKPAGEWTWPKVNAGPATDTRWPGPVEKFSDIWKTNISGKVPPPPPPPAPPVPPDPVREFQAGLRYLGGFEVPGQPELSTARVSFGGKEMSISPGGKVGDFQLLQFRIDQKARTVKLVFKHPQTGAPFEIQQQPVPVPPLTGPGNEPFVRQPSSAVDDGRVSENGPLSQTAYQDPATGDWVIPEDEQLWIQFFGEKVSSKLATQPDVDANGVAHGLRIRSVPELNTPLAPSHGIVPSDVIRSINGVPMTSKEDVVNYLRGAGKGLSRYDVVIDTAGSERTVVYRLAQRRVP